jgi:hypothetical protein
MMAPATRTVIVAVTVAVAMAVFGGTTTFAQAALERTTPSVTLTGALVDEAGRPLAHADVQACAATLCLYGESDADGRFRFELPVNAAPYVVKTLEDLSAMPRRAAAIAPVRLSGRPRIDMGAVYVPHLPDGRSLRPAGSERLRMDAGDGLELTFVRTDLVPSPGKILTTLAARRIPPSQVAAYDLPGGETVVAVYAIHPFGTTSRLPIGVKAPSTLPPGTPVWFRTIREIDGAFSEPAPGLATGTHVVTDRSMGIGELTHLVITR